MDSADNREPAVAGAPVKGRRRGRMLALYVAGLLAVVLALLGAWLWTAYISSATRFNGATSTYTYNTAYRLTYESHTGTGSDSFSFYQYTNGGKRRFEFTSDP